MTDGTADFRWNDLELLVVVCDRRSLGRAAADLGVSQSTVSRRLGALEAALGAQLFTRTVDGVAPTRAARLLVPFGEQMRQLAARVTQQASGVDETISGNVRVAMPEAVATFLIIPKLPAFRAQHPGIDLEVLSGIEHVDMARNEADLALRLTRPERGAFVVKRVGSIEYRVFTHERHLSRNREPDLRELEWVTWTARYEHIPDAAWLRRAVAQPRRVLRLQSLVSIAFAVEAGVGAALLPRAIGQLLDHVVELETNVQTPVVPLWLVGHKANSSIARFRAVADFLTEASKEA